MNYQCFLLSSSLLASVFVNAQVFEATTDPLSLHAKAAKAHAESRTTVDLGIQEGIPPITTSFDNAIKHYSVLLVRTVKSEAVTENGRDIVTWFTVDIKARLSVVPGSPLAPSLNQLFTIKPTSVLRGNQIFLLHHGGSVLVDGVQFTERVADFPMLKLSTEYLCLLALSEDGKTAIVPLGGTGVYEVSDDNRIKSLSSRPSPIRSEIDTLGSLSEVVAYFQSYKTHHAGVAK